MFIILTLMMVSQVYTYVKTHQIVHFKYVQLIICQSYLKRRRIQRREKLEKNVSFQRQNSLNIGGAQTLKERKWHGKINEREEKLGTPTALGDVCRSPLS